MTESEMTKSFWDFSAGPWRKDRFFLLKGALLLTYSNTGEIELTFLRTQKQEYKETILLQMSSEILGWPQSSFRCFQKMIWKNSKELWPAQYLKTWRLPWPHSFLFDLWASTVTVPLMKLTLSISTYSYLREFKLFIYPNQQGQEKCLISTYNNVLNWNSYLVS